MTRGSTKTTRPQTLIGRTEDANQRGAELATSTHVLMTARSGDENRPWQMKRGRKSSTAPWIIWSHYTGRIGICKGQRGVYRVSQPRMSVFSHAWKMALKHCWQRNIWDFTSCLALAGTGVVEGQLLVQRSDVCLCDLPTTQLSNIPGVICPTSGSKLQESERCILQTAGGMLSSRTD